MFDYIFAVVAMLSFGLSPLFYKYVINANVSPVIANEIRAFMTLIIMLIYFIPSFLGIWKVTFYDIIMFAIVAFFGAFLGDTVYFYSLKYTDVSITAPVSSSYAIIIVIIMFAFFKESISIFEIIGGLIIILGIWIIQERTKRRMQKIGVFLALLSALFYAIAIVIMNIVLPSTSIESMVMFRIIFTLLFLLPLSISQGNFPKLPKIWILLGIGGFLGIGIGVVFMLYSMETIGVVATGLFSSASPMITSFLGIILFKERKSLIKIVGISLIIIGLIIVSI